MFVGTPLADIVSAQTLITPVRVSGNQQWKLFQPNDNVSNLFTNLVN